MNLNYFIMTAATLQNVKKVKVSEYFLNALYLLPVLWNERNTHVWSSNV